MNIMILIVINTVIVSAIHFFYQIINLSTLNLIINFI